MSFKDLLTPQQRREVNHRQTYHLRRLGETQRMSDKELADATEYAMRQMLEPRQHLPGEPVYNSSFYHIYVPEMVRRLRRK